MPSNALRHGFADPDAFAIFLDVDGTLLDFAEKPSAVAAPARLIPTLAQLDAALSGAVALVSGRAIGELDRLFAPLRLRASGVHGAQMRFDPGAEVVASPDAIELPPSLWRALETLLQDFPGTFAENKRYSFAVHFRQAPQFEAPLRRAVGRLIAEPSFPLLQMMDAHCAIEIKTSGFDKGMAVSRFLAASPFRGRTPLYIGDDDTDEPAFAAVSARSGLAYSVGRRRPNTAGAFVQPQAVREWLAALLETRSAP